MADDAPTPAPDPNDQTQALIQQMLRQTLTGQGAAPVQVQEPAHSGDNRTWGSLLGQALVGGAGPGSTDAANEQAGLRGLMSVGLGMMSGSDYSQARHSLGSIIANSIEGAQQGNYAQNAAQLEYQKAQQEMQLARLKEALPLLTQLRQMQVLKGMPNPLAGTPGAAPGANTSIAAVGAVPGGTLGPGEAPINAAGDSATRKAAEGGPPAPGTPAAKVAQQVHDFWIGKGLSEAQVAGIMAGGPGSESNFDPTVFGDKRTSYGLYQLHADRLDGMRKYFGLSGDQMPTADQQNQYAAWEMSPQGPKAAVGAALLKAQTPAEAAAIYTRSYGVPADKTEIGRRAAGAGRYLGLYGQPQPPGAPGAPATAQTPPAGPTGAAPGVAQGDVARPDLAPGPPGSTGGAPTGIGAALAPPPVAGAPQLPIKGTPIPSGKLLKSDAGPADATPNVDASGQVIADTRTPQEIRLGGVQTAGPGAGPSLPPSPVVAPVAVPQPGWGTGAATGYNVGTTGAAPPPPAPAATPQPAAVVTAQTPPPAPIPVAAKPDSDLTFEEYRDRHGYQPTDAERSSWQITPDPEALHDAQAAKLAASQQLQLARAGMGDGDKALATYNVANDAVNKLRQEAQIQTANNQKDWFAKRDDMLAANYRAARQEAAAAAEAQRQRDAAVGLKTQEGQQAIQLEQARGRTADESKVMQGLDESYESARGAKDQIELTRALSQSAGDPTFWQTVQTSHPELVKALANLGALSEGQVTQLGQAGAMDAAANKLISMARTGSGFQRMTNLDVQILSSQAPQGTDPQQWREAKMAYLQSYMERQMRYIDTVRTLRADGAGLYDAQKRAANEVGDVVPKIPTFTDTPQKSAGQQRAEWALDNLAPNTFFRAPDGKLLIYRGPNAGAPAAAPMAPRHSLAPSLVPVN